MIDDQETRAYEVIRNSMFLGLKTDLSLIWNAFTSIPINAVIEKSNKWLYPANPTDLLNRPVLAKDYETLELTTSNLGLFKKKNRLTGVIQQTGLSGVFLTLRKFLISLGLTYLEADHKIVMTERRVIYENRSDRDNMSRTVLVNSDINLSKFDSF